MKILKSNIIKRKDDLLRKMECETIRTSYLFKICILPATTTKMKNK